MLPDASNSAASQLRPWDKLQEKSGKTKIMVSGEDVPEETSPLNTTVNHLEVIVPAK